MALTKYRLGDFLELFNERCGVPDLTVWDISGVNSDKEFFEPSKQAGSDTSNYKIVPPDYFACNLMHVGRDVVLPIALNHSGKQKIVSPAYTVFKIKDGTPLIKEYAFYLIAKYRFNASYNENMHLTSLWFFYASMVSLYTGSFESTVENHLNSIKELTTLEEYKRFILSRVVERLTNDYFDITLIGSEGLAVSGRGNNAWNAYVAALNILNAKILFSKSNLLVSKLFEPGTDGKRKSLEKHHLFPKAYLKTLGYNDAKINQMANYAFIDWKDNMEILDEAPAIYYPVVCEGRSPEEIQRMEEENALPHGWENMSYEDFLVERRKLMATKIKQAFEILKNNAN